MSSRIRKFDSGYEKRKKKKLNEELAKSQRGALDKYFVKVSYVITENTIDAENVVIENEIDVVFDENNNSNVNFDVNVENVNIDTNIDEDEIHENEHLDCK